MGSDLDWNVSSNSSTAERSKCKPFSAAVLQSWGLEGFGTGVVWETFLAACYCGRSHPDRYLWTSCRCRASRWRAPYGDCWTATDCSNRQSLRIVVHWGRPSCDMGQSISRWWQLWNSTPVEESVACSSHRCNTSNPQIERLLRSWKMALWSHGAIQARVGTALQSKISLGVCGRFRPQLKHLLRS